jgi:quercetin dioxygenase-like cupin family protein
MRFVNSRLHLLLAMPPRFWAAFFVVLAAGCASGPPKLPYPAFIQADKLEDVFMAALPGVRAKQFAGNPQTGRTSNRINLPPAWKGTTGGTPGKSLEIYVLAGELEVADVKLGPGGYAHVPPGTFGFNMQSIDGAQVLYFLDDVDPLAMIRSPIILDSRIVDWQPGDVSGVSIKELRSDPGNGARTWVMKVEPGATIPWQSSSVVREGYLASGQYQHSECVGGEVHTAIYNTGGYFYRPADAIHGGPAATAISESVWVLRERTASSEKTVESCE